MVRVEEVNFIVTSISVSNIDLYSDQDGAEPSGNSVSVQNLMRLATLLDKTDYAEKTEQILSVFTSRLTRFPLSLPEMIYGLMFHYDSPTQVVYLKGRLAIRPSLDLNRFLIFFFWQSTR